MRTTTPLFSLGLIAACGNNDNAHLPDAPQGSGNDAPLAPDASSGSVTVEVTVAGAPAANVTVYFLAADNTVISSTATDANGSASAMVSTGASVTLIEPALDPRPPGTGDQTFALDTWNGVEPGDVLHDDFEVSSTGSSASVTLDVVDDNPSIFNYFVSSTCGSTTLDAEGGPRPRIVGTTTLACTGSADFLVMANDSDDVPVDSLYVPNLDVEPGATLDITGDYVTVDDGTVNIANVGTSTTDFSVERDLFSPNGIAFSTTFDVAPQGDGTALGQSQFPMASSIPDTIVAATVSESNRTGAIFDDQTFVQWGPPVDGYQLDLSTVELPHYTNMPSVDTTAHQIVWTSSAGAVSPELESATVHVQRTDGQLVDSWSWKIAAPASQYGAIQMPTLPTDTFDFTIAAGDTVQVTGVEAASVPGGYDAVRAFAFDDILTDVPATASGSISVSSIAPDTAVGSRQRHRRAHMTVAHRRR